MSDNRSPVERHEHDVSCAFGNPQCDLYLNPAPSREHSPLHSPTEAKFYIALFLTWHAVMSGIVITSDWWRDYLGPTAVGYAAFSAFIFGMVAAYLPYAFPKDKP